LEQALELLLNGSELQSTDDFLYNECDDDGDEDVQIVQRGNKPGTKRSRSAAEDPEVICSRIDNIFSAGQARGIGHIFVDHSNMSLVEEYIPAFDYIASIGLCSFHERVVVGSQTETPGQGRIERAWKAIGYSAHFQQKRANQPESFVDDSLVAHIQRAVLQHLPEGRTIVLATGDGNSNDGKPSFLEAVVEALLRHWRVVLIHRGSVNKAYTRLQKEHKDLFCIQRVCSAQLEKALKKIASLSYQPLVRATCANRQSPVAVPPPASSALTAEQLRSARLKYFCPQNQAGETLVTGGGELASGACDASCLDDNDAAPSTTLCFKGKQPASFANFFRTKRSRRSGLKFALYQLQWAGDTVLADVTDLIQQNGGAVSASLRETGVTHIICNGAVYRQV
jgi:hypothetical protein